MRGEGWDGIKLAVRREAGKPGDIHLHDRPSALRGIRQLDRDRQMLEYTKAGDDARLAMLVLHDDAKREYAYGPAQGLPDTRVGTFVFAICVPIYQSGFSVSGLVVQLIEIAIFVPLILFGLSRLGAYILKKVEDDEDAYFILMLAIVAVAGLLAQSINLPGIVGAFLAGLAVNAAVRDKPAKEKLEFFGDSFFIPIFFIVTGFLIDPVVFFRSITTNFPLVSAVIGALLVGKWIAAQTVGRAFAYTPAARMTMWSLTLPRVAATLAATLVAFDTRNPAGQPLVDSRLLNVVLVLMVTTSILGPVLTEHFAPRFLKEAMPPDRMKAPGTP